MAATLPPELVQSILLSIEPDTYHTARQTCRSWRKAASSAYMLREALRRTPTPLPGPSLNAITDDEWNVLYTHVARLNLFGKRDRITKRVLRRKRPSNWSHSTVIGVSGDGARLVSLSGPRASIYNVSETRELQYDLSQSLHSLWTLMNRAMVDDCTRGMTMGYHGAKYRIALSTNGALVAIALCRTIQIYDLSRMDQSPVEHTLGEGELLTAVEFAENDSLLRVCIAKDPNDPNSESSVRYLGRPLPSWGGVLSHASSPTTLEYWRQNIHSVYLDSVALARSYRDDNKTCFQGLRLLPRRACEGWSEPVRGRFFVMAVQNTDVDDRYCIGFVADSDPSQVRIWRQFPSRMDRTSDRWSHLFRGCGSSESPDADDGRSDAAVVERNRQSAHERWNPVNIPAVTTKHSLLAVSDDGKILVAYERGAGHLAFSKGGALYVFGLEGCSRNNPNSTDGFSPAQMQSWSFLLDIVDDDIDTLRVVAGKKDDSAIYTIAAENLHNTTEWELS